MLLWLCPSLPSAECWFKCPTHRKEEYVNSKLYACHSDDLLYCTAVITNNMSSTVHSPGMWLWLCPSTPWWVCPLGPCSVPWGWGWIIPLVWRCCGGGMAFVRRGSITRHSRNGDWSRRIISKNCKKMDLMYSICCQWSIGVLVIVSKFWLSKNKEWGI
jgi:hypothetical protein